MHVSFILGWHWYQYKASLLQIATSAATSLCHNLSRCPQILAMTVRADIPLELNLLQLFWKNLVGEDLDPVTDLSEADTVTYNYIKNLEMVSRVNCVY